MYKTGAQASRLHGFIKQYSRLRLASRLRKAASETLRGLLAMGKLQFAQEPTLTRLLEGASVEFSGQTLRVTFNASGEVIKQLQEMRAAARVGR